MFFYGLWIVIVVIHLGVRFSNFRQAASIIFSYNEMSKGLVKIWWVFLQDKRGASGDKSTRLEWYRVKNKN